MEKSIWHDHYDWCVDTTYRYPRIPVGQLLENARCSAPDKTAIDFYGTRYTFWELRDMTARMTAELHRLGVKKGDRVGLHLPNSPQFLIAFFACQKLGAIVVNMNPLYTADELTHIIEVTGITALFTFDLMLPTVKPLLESHPVPLVVVTRITDFIKGAPRSTSGEICQVPGWQHFSSLIEESASRVPLIDVIPDDPSVIQFTGGTTGFPKGAVLTHGNIVAATMQASLWGLAAISSIPIPERTTLCVLPFFHVYGMVVGMLYSIFNLNTMIVFPRFEVEEVLAFIGGYANISFFPAVPTMITALINHPKAEEARLIKKLGLLQSGGAPLPMSIIETLRAEGVNYSEGWGMSETASLGVANPIVGMKKHGSIGIPFPDTQVRLMDLEGGDNEVEPGEPGEMVIKSPLVMKGYWNDEIETRNQLKDGWLRTGDIATMDGDGYFFIVDRKKDMIIAGGYNIYPREVDEVLMKHPMIAEACAYGLPHEYRGETVKAVVVPVEGAVLSEKEISEYCKQHLAAYKVPKIIEVRETPLPKSAVGKVLRKLLLEEDMKKR
ncbi:MAG: long-chain fatty acid--CoA ligase [Spirochaetes bacterium]|nr:MAG: long-chain fatty acid--CoA ligase [Spirochaetota bacterium]